MIKQNQRILNGILVLLDLAVILCAYIFAWFLKFNSGIFPHEGHLSFLEYMRVLFFIFPAALVLNYVFDLYTPQRTKSFYSEVYSVLKSDLVLFMILMSYLFVIKQIDISRMFIGIFIIVNFVFLFFERGFIRYILRYMRKKGYNIKYIIVIGAGELTEKYLEEINKNRQYGYNVLGVFSDKENTGKEFAGKPVLGRINEIEEYINGRMIDEAVIALEIWQYEMLPDILNICEKKGIKTLIIPDYLKYVSSRPYSDEIGEITLINTRYVPLDNLGNKMVKRLSDIFISALALILVLPVMIICAFCIKFCSKGPVVFRQERVGLNQKKFTMYKFRSMKQQEKEESDTVWTKSDDERTTKIGCFMRKTSIDELPQLWNVLKGDMSIVGPRPERPYFVEKFMDEIPKYMIKHHVKPGITGWAQVNGYRGDTSIEERINHDIYYIENWSLFFDLRIMIMTFFGRKVRENAY